LPRIGRGKNKIGKAGAGKASTLEFAENAKGETPQRVYCEKQKSWGCTSRKSEKLRVKNGGEGTKKEESRFYHTARSDTRGGGHSTAMRFLLGRKGLSISKPMDAVERSPAAVSKKKGNSGTRKNYCLKGGGGGVGHAPRHVKKERIKI